jgi:UDP-N-acetylmuramate dehydrogenase
VTSARDAGFLARLRQAVRGAVLEEEPLARYTTYRIGGPATLLQPADPADVATALRLAAEAGIPVLPLGLGSNVLLPDAGLDALVVRLGKGLDRIEDHGDRWILGAGLPAPLAARRTAAAGWGGLHLMVGVPGTVGGGVVMNAGCHGGQWSDVVAQVTVADASGTEQVLPATAIAFGYRRSGLVNVVVLEVEVRLRPAEPAELEDTIRRLLLWRQRGTPFNLPCCGSVFQNPSWADGGSAPPPHPDPGAPRTAGQLIEASGLKGYRLGGVEVSPLHANYFVNRGGATADEVRRLMDYVRGTVRERFGIELQPEVKVIGPRGELLDT